MTIMRYLVIATVIAGLGLLFIAQKLFANPAKAAESEVRIENFTFRPATLTVPIGTAVTFTNADDIPHSIVATDGTFHSKALDTGDAFTFTFRKTGDVAFFCGMHPHMTGRVVVMPP